MWLHGAIYHFNLLWFSTMSLFVNFYLFPTSGVVDTAIYLHLSYLYSYTNIGRIRALIVLVRQVLRKSLPYYPKSIWKIIITTKR